MSLFFYFCAFLTLGGILTFAALPSGLFIHRNVRHWNRIDAVAASLIPITIAGLFWVHASTCIRLTTDLWHGARFALPVSFTAGFPLYVGQDGGPISNLIYPPLAALIYVPIAFIFQHSLTLSLFLAAVWGWFLIYIPAALIFWKCSGDTQQGKVFAFFAFALFTITNLTPGVHADVPAIFFSAWACFSLFSKGNSIPNLILSSVLTVFALWSKQTTAPLMIALPLYTAFLYGKRFFFYHVAFLTLSFTLISGGMLLFFDGDDLFFNIGSIPMNHPWKVLQRNDYGLLIEGLSLGQRLKSLASAWKDFIERIFLFVVIIIFAFFNSTEDSKLKEKFRAFKTSLPFFLFWIALTLIPFALMNRVKIGGGWNAFSIAFYFLIASAMSASINLANHSNSILRSQFRLLLLLSSLAFVFSARFHEVPFNLSTGFLQPNPHQQASSFIEKNPGPVYLPWRPLSHLYVERRLYHFAYGVRDREYANFAPTAEQMHAYAPKEMRLIGFFENEAQDILKYFPEFSEKVTFPEMPGWTFYKKRNFYGRT